MEWNPIFYDTSYGKWVLVLCLVGLGAHLMSLFDYSKLQDIAGDFPQLERAIREVTEFPIYKTLWAYVTIPLFGVLLFMLMSQDIVTARFMSIILSLGIVLLTGFNIIIFHIKYSLFMKLLGKIFRVLLSMVNKAQDNLPLNFETKI